MSKFEAGSKYETEAGSVAIARRTAKSVFDAEGRRYAIRQAKFSDGSPCGPEYIWISGRHSFEISSDNKAAA